MTEADVIQPSASIASTGPGIRYIGNSAYAYSGQINTLSNNTALTYLDFTTGAGYIVGYFHFSIDVLTGDDMTFNITFNDLTIWEQRYGNTDPAEFQQWPARLVIPPLTAVKLLITDHSSNAVPVCAIFTGRVYGAE